MGKKYTKDDLLNKTVAFRLPKDTNDEILDYLLKLKNDDKIKFGNAMRELVEFGIRTKRDREMNGDFIKVPVPANITIEQKKWINHPQTIEHLSKLIYNFINDPFGVVNSNEVTTNQSNVVSQSTQVFSDINNISEQTEVKEAYNQPSNEREIASKEESAALENNYEVISKPIVSNKKIQDAQIQEDNNPVIDTYEEDSVGSNTKESENKGNEENIFDTTIKGSNSPVDDNSDVDPEEAENAFNFFAMMNKT